MRKNFILLFHCFAIAITSKAQSFTSGNLVALQTSGTSSKAASAITLKEFSTTGTAGISVALPVAGTNPIQAAGVFGGSEGFLTTSTDNKYLVLGAYGTSGTYSDITGTLSSAVPRIIATVAPSGFCLQVASSDSFYSGNDIRGAVSDGTNYWASGASNASVDGINYFGPSSPDALATGTTPPKAYGLRIFNGQLYYSTQKSGPSNTSSQLGIFAVGTGLPTSSTVSVSQVINTGSIVPQDFSFNAAGTVCYIAISLNTSAGGIQKWTKSGSAWTLAYTLGTGATNIGAYGLVVDYSGTNPIIYATTFESAGNRIVKIVDNGTAGTASITTIVAATTGTIYKGITFAPVASGTPVVNMTLSADTASEAGASVITIAAHSSAELSSAASFTVDVSGLGISAGDYSLSATTITIPSGSSVGSISFTVNDDILGEGTETARIALRSSSSAIVLGIDSVKTITIADNDGNNFPQIVLQVDSTTDFIDAGATSSPASPFVVSGVINDPTDPAATHGLAFLLSDLETVSTALSLSVSSSDTDVVPLSNISITGLDSIRYIKILPKGIGYSNIVLSVSDGIDSSSYTLLYAASADSLLPDASFWHTGISDASAAIALDDDYYIVGDDELNVLNVYANKASGMPLYSFEYTLALALPNPSKPEVDVEAAALSYKNANRIYWLGSMSNGKAPFDAKPNRDRIFATSVSGTGAASSCSVLGYGELKNSIIAWGDANGYNFTASAAAGVDSKLPNGFGAEAMVFGPDSTTLYIGLRTPLVPITARNNALIVPIKNFETWFNNGSPIGTPTFAAPIELNLGGRGLRDMIRLQDGTYILIAGNTGGSPLKGAIYKWTGNVADTAILVACAYADQLNIEAVLPHGITRGQLQVITDNGDDELYNDGRAAKDFNDLILRKFRSVVLDSLDLSMSSTSIKAVASSHDAVLRIYPNPAKDLVNISFQGTMGEAYQLIISDLQGKKVWSQAGMVKAETTDVKVPLNTLANGVYLLQIQSASRSTNHKLIKH